MKAQGWKEPVGLWDGAYPEPPEGFEPSVLPPAEMPSAWASPATDAGAGDEIEADASTAYKGEEESEHPDCWDFEFFDTKSWSDWMQWWNQWDFYWIIDAESYQTDDDQAWYDDVCDGWCTVTYNTEPPVQTYQEWKLTYVPQEDDEVLSDDKSDDSTITSYGRQDDPMPTYEPTEEPPTTEAPGGDDGGEAGDDTETGGDDGEAADDGGEAEADDTSGTDTTEDDETDVGTGEAVPSVLAEVDARETIGRLSAAFANARATLLSQ